MRELRGKTAVVTGAANGIGQGLAVADELRAVLGPVHVVRNNAGSAFAARFTRCPTRTSIGCEETISELGISPAMRATP